MSQPQATAAIEVQMGSWINVIQLCFGPYFWKYYATVDGIEHQVSFKTPTAIPVTPGFHMVEFYVRGLLEKRRRNCTQQIGINVSHGMVQEVRYRIVYFPFGMILNEFRMGYVKLYNTKPMGMYGYAYGSMPQQPHYQHFSQGGQQNGHYAPPQYPPHVASQFTDPFTDQGHGQQTATSYAAASAKTKYCTQCGSELVAGNRFCGGCGQQTNA
ncbi:zinc ribbon domain-containing protein [Lacipirellula sp.]|uniref:zinc ribbon domain-containing protein n=1 Tax=Lacipirellula sp. TaxID=2691419 RepID=UPI003D10E2D1